MEKLFNPLKVFSPKTTTLKDHFSPLRWSTQSPLNLNFIGISLFLYFKTPLMYFLKEWFMIPKLMAESLFCFKDIRSESDIKSSIHSSLISIV